MSKLETLWNYIDAAIRGDRLIYICITSAAEGKIKAEGFSFGEGKSTLAMGLAKMINKKHHSLGDLQAEELIKNNIGYKWEHHVQAVKEAYDKRKLVYIMDDLQRIAGLSHSRNRDVQQWAEFFTTARPFFAVIIVTCPDLGELAKCFRRLMTFEVKVPIRGIYEVQRIKTKTIFKDPLNPVKLLEYFGEATFPKPSQSLESWYEEWRKESSFDIFEDMITKQGLNEKEEEQLPLPEPTEIENAGRILARARWGK